MTKKEDRMWADRELAQKKIREQYGMTTIKSKVAELCDNCEKNPCHLLPITTQGEDCPYFEPLVKDGK